LSSSGNLIRLAFGAVKIAVIVGVGVWSLWGERERLLAIGSLGASGIAASLAEITLWTCLKMGAALLVLGLADYGYQRWRHEQDLRMTPAELREELKNQQSDPSVANRRRTLHRQLTFRHLQDVVPEAKLLIAHGTSLVVAIEYDSESMSAPRVLAKGSGETAMRIRDVAQQHNIPIENEPGLARALYERTPVRQAIPPEHYKPMATLLRDARGLLI
jgi:flagellar biosynthetic protein FlhB